MTDSFAAWYDNNPVVQGIAAAAYERGVAAGRAQAAADIRAHLGPDPSPANPAWWAGYTEALSDCARLAEGPAAEEAP